LDPAIQASPKAGCPAQGCSRPGMTKKGDQAKLATGFSASRRSVAGRGAPFLLYWSHPPRAPPSRFGRRPPPRAPPPPPPPPTRPGLACPDSAGASPAAQRLLAAIPQFAGQGSGGTRRLHPDRVDQRAADHEWRPEDARQTLQPARRIDRVADYRERHALSAADVAEHGRAVVEADADIEAGLAP